MKKLLFAKCLVLFAILIYSCCSKAQAQQNKSMIDAQLALEMKKNGWAASDISEYIISDQYTDKKTGLTYTYIQQKHQGIIVFNAISVLLARNNEVLFFKPGLVDHLEKKLKSGTPSITAAEAISKAFQHLGKTVQEQAKWVSGDQQNHIYRYAIPEIASGEVKVRLVYRVMEEKAFLAWDVSMEMKHEPHWWNIRIDAVTGEFIDKNDFTTACTFGDLSQGFLAHDDQIAQAPMAEHPPLVPEYTVFPFPLEAPSFGSRSLLTDPSDAIASPYGWHDVDGIAGNDYSITRGNNVYAYEDANNDNLPGYSPASGTLQFNFPFTSGAAPLTNQDASITNLFYVNNRVHDVLYHAGFNEVAGNFQQNNYGNGGLGNDYVKAEAFDGSGTNNANFSTPADGASGRMQMYLWSGTPQLDGSFDNGVISHEYGHGVSNRLTGGPSQASCLANAEQGGEGWSDWLALIMTIEPGDNGAMARGIGTYVKGQAPSGGGIRRYPYSTNMSINPQTYANLAASSGAHQKGEIWCDAIWDMTWFLIDDLGFNSNPMVETSGNYIAMRLVLEGMKLQPCSPGYLDARDAILLADAILYDNAHRCRIWEAFARRGMGYNASQGSSNSSTDQVAGFSLPPFCLTPTQVPVAVFSSDLTTVACGGSVKFTDQSIQPFSWLWDFGDMTTSTLQHPTHKYTSPGTFTVTLTVTNPLGSNSASNTITVISTFTANLTANPSAVCSGESVVLNAAASGSSNITYNVSSIPFAPLTGTATNVPLTDDVMSSVKPIGFTFNFFGQDYSNFYICSNGFITFSSGQLATNVYGMVIPSAASPNNIIALAWNDLFPEGVSSAISYFNTGVAPNRKLVVQYNTRHYGGAAYPFIVQAILYEGSNIIDIHTTAISDASAYDAGATTTQGLENATGSAGVWVPGRNGTIFSASNDAYRFTPYTPYTYNWLPGNLNGAMQSVYPSSTGSYTVNIADGSGCIQPFSSPTININPCTVMELNVFLEGFYNDISNMRATKFDMGLSANPDESDDITVNLWSPGNLSNTSPDYSASAVLHTNGTATVQIPANLTGQSYYISVKHRNHLETWSALPYTFSPPHTYDFTSSQSAAFDDGVDANPPMAPVAGGKYAIYAGDVNQDGGVDGQDASALEIDVNAFAYGYNTSDANGDGSSDGLDASAIEVNANLFIFYSRP